MNAPQVIYIVIVTMCLTLEACRHGEEKKSRKYNAYWEAGGWAVFSLLLWWGGFFA